MIIKIKNCHNPYFNRWFSAICYACSINNRHIESHNPYFNRWFSAILYNCPVGFIPPSHNPYFNRWFSAIYRRRSKDNCQRVTILILIDGFLQYTDLRDSFIQEYGHNPYFNRWFSAIQAVEGFQDVVEVTILILIDGFLQCD